MRIARRESAIIAGTPEQVRAGLDELHQQFGIDEFIIDTPVAEGRARVNSLLLLAQAVAQTQTLQEVAG